MDERRILLAVFLMFLVFYLYSTFLTKAPPPRARTTPPAAPNTQAAAPPPPEVVPPPPPPGVQQPPQSGASAAAPRAKAATVVGEQAERTITIDTRVVRAVFTNRGGELVSWRLKQYLDDRKRPLDLVARNLPGGAPLPFTLRTEDPEVTARLDEALFRASDEASGIDGTRGSVRLTFEYEDATGLRARKDFVLEPNSYVVQLDATVSQGDRSFNPMVVWGPGLGDAAAAESSRYLQKPEALFFGQGVRRVAAAQLTPDKCEGARTENGCAWEGDFRFAGVDDHYFVSAVLPKGKMRIEYQAVAVQVPVESSPGFWERLLSALGIGGAPAGTVAKTATNELVSYAAKVASATPGMRVFAGPKDFDVLKAADPEMVRIINFGIFGWLAVPLLRALKSINGYVGNYGWSIIILTILINAAMFPLRHKSMVSMRKMQALQPEIKAIQGRYSKLKATDPARQKMNAEMMSLYREKGVNPASGCVPMLLTMPVLFAFYSMLGQAIEVRGAPFAFWIQDLSRSDPYYVLPILMGLTMLWQQKMTPSSVDPAQQKMMMFMPVMFTAFFLWAPSGLALYFLLSNLLAIGQQYLTNNLISPARARAGGPPAGRRGKGKPD
jgi:YidC/Oxa1 family membrane protein insertase